MRFAPTIVLIVAMTGAVAACHPRNQTEQAGQSAQPAQSGQTGQSGQSVQSGQTEERHGGGGHHLRRICADDIAKYCQNEDKKRRCLKQNVDKLSADCKAAVEALHGGHNRNNDKTGDSDD